LTKTVRTRKKDTKLEMNSANIDQTQEIYHKNGTLYKNYAIVFVINMACPS